MRQCSFACCCCDKTALAKSNLGEGAEVGMRVGAAGEGVPVSRGAYLASTSRSQSLVEGTLTGTAAEATEECCL